MSCQSRCTVVAGLRYAANHCDSASCSDGASQFQLRSAISTIATTVTAAMVASANRTGRGRERRLLAHLGVFACIFAIASFGIVSAPTDGIAAGHAFFAHGLLA